MSNKAARAIAFALIWLIAGTSHAGAQNDRKRTKISVTAPRPNDPCWGTSPKKPAKDNRNGPLWFCKFDRPLTKTLYQYLQPVPGIDRGVTSEPAIMDSEYEFLSQKFPETRGYGRYTYLVLAGSSKAAVRNHEVLTELLDDTTYAGKLGLARASLNVFELPVRHWPAANAFSSMPLLERGVESVYDYAAARAILDRACTGHDVRDTTTCAGAREVGPYLVTCDRPVTDRRSFPTPYLVVDLSAMPTGLLWYYVREMKLQVQSPSLGGPTRIYSAKNRLLNWMYAVSIQVPAIEKAVLEIVKH